MAREGWSPWSLLIALFLLAGCAAQVSPRALPDTATVETERGEAVPVTARVQPTAAASETPTAAAEVNAAQPAAPSPSPTAAPAAITVAVPESWQKVIASTVEQINSRAGSARWHLVESEAADVKLVKNAQGIVVKEGAIVLAVPFTMAWESVTREEAERILSDGHEQVRVMPWEDMNANQKALRIDGLGPSDSGYPFVETWSLVGDMAYDEAMHELAEQVSEDGQTSIVHLVAVGDIMLDRSLGDALEAGEVDYPFAPVAASLASADLTVGNFESALGSGGRPEAKRYPFLSPPQAAPALQAAGFDLVSLANNHGMDYGEEALLQAIDLLQKSGITAVGAGANETRARSPRIVEVNGLKTAFLGYVNVPVEATSGFDTASWAASGDKAGIAWADAQMVTADVSAVRPHVDLVVVLLHSGIEYQAAPSEAQREAAYAAVDAGADLVIGHHTHILQGIEQYGDGVILYGTGNFAFDINGSPETAIFHIWLDQNGVREIAVQPAVVQKGGQPRLADSDEAAAIRERIYFLTDLLNAE